MKDNLDVLLDKLSKKSKKKQIQSFKNGDYAIYADKLRAQNKGITQAVKSGKPISSKDLIKFNDSINNFKSLTAQSGFDSASVKQLNDISNSYQQNLNTFKQLNAVFAQREKDQKALDKAKNQAQKDKWAKTINIALGAMADPSNSDTIETIKKGQPKLSQQLEQSNKKVFELKQKLASDNEQIAPFLDRELTRKRWENEKSFSKEKERAKTDRDLAYNAYHKKLADKYMQNAEIKALSDKAGIASANADTSGAGTIISVLTGSAINDPSMLSDVVSNNISKKEISDKIKKKIKSLGYKGTERDLNDTVNYIVEQAAQKENETRTKNLKKELASAANVHPVLASAAEAVIGGASKIPGGAYALGKTIEGYISDKPVTMDENSAYFAGSNAYNTITSTVAGKIKSKTGKELYLQAMSLADNASRAVLSLGLGGAGEAVGLSIMAMSVMSDTALSLTQQGYNATAAGSLAFVAAAAEVITEKISLDKLQAFKSMSNIASKKILALNIAKQAFVEGTEEVGSDLINNVADLVYEMYSDNSSQKEREIKNKMLEEHITYEEAYKKWHTEHITEYVKDFAAGAASGLILGGGATASNYAVNSARQSANFRAFEDSNAKQTYKQNRQRVKAELNAIQKEYAAKGQPISKTQAKMVFQSRSGNAESGNALYDGLIQSAFNHSDTSVQAAANKLQENLNLGKVSYTAAGRLINKMEAANTNISAGVATQLLDSAEASSAVKSAVKNAILGKELTKGEIKQIKGSQSALDVISALSGVRISENSTNEEIEDVARSLYGATFDIDTSTDYGRAYSAAAKLRNEGKIGFNGVKGFTASYNDKLGMSMDDYSNMFAMAYNMAMAKNTSEEIADRMRDNFFGDDEGENIARAHVISVAVANAGNDVAFERKQEEKERANKKAEKQEQSEQTENKEETEENLAAETQMRLEGENVREHAAALASLSEDEKGEVYENGGAIVESEQQLNTRQSVIVSAYEYLGKKRGVAYIFVDSINGNKEAKGSHISGLNIIYIRIGDIADMTSAAGHELGHWLKDNYSEEYKKLQEYIKTTLYSKEGYSLEYRIKEVQERYAKEAGQNLSEDEALNEITNNALFGIDMGSAEFEKFIKDNLTIYERILEFFKNLIEDLKDFFSTVTDIREVRELKDDVEFIKSTADIVEGIIGKQSEKIEQAQKENTQEGDVKYLLSDNFDKNYDYSKNISKVANMPVVAKLEGTEFAKGEVDLITQVSNYFDSIGNIVNSKYGDIILKKRGIKSAIGHRPMYRNKAISFKAIPDVINKGEVIDYQKNWKGRKYDTIVFAAPISIADNRYYMATVIKVFPDSNEYYLHDVLISKKETISRLKTGTTQKGTPSGKSSPLFSLLLKLQNVKENSAKEQFQLSDSDYLEAAENGDEEKAAELVEEAAKNWGAYSDENGKPIMFYHGTKSFGFTEFDLEKMDDKRSIFLTSDNVSAQSYSSVSGVRKINNAPKDIDYRNMSKKELVETLNKYSVFNEKYDIKYEYYSKEKIERLINSKDDVLNGILDLLKKELKEPSVTDEKAKRIKRLSNMVMLGLVQEVSANLYTATKAKYGIAFLDSKKYEKLYNEIYRISIFEKTKEDIKDGAIVEKMGVGYEEIIPVKEAHSLLNYWTTNTAGNYALYAKLDNPLVIDNKGRNWNDIHLSESQRRELVPKEVRDRMEDFISGLEENEEWVDKGAYTLDGLMSRTGAAMRASLKELMLEAYRGDFVTTDFPWGTYGSKDVFERDMSSISIPFTFSKRTTRDVAELAQQAGYDGVVFKNIRDNGGRGMVEPDVADYITVVFDSSQTKSADPITYDDNDEIIPLSERFSNSGDIRYQITDRTLTPEEEAQRRADIAEAENRRMSRENEKLQQALEYQKKQLRLSKDFRHDSKKTADEAKRLIKKLEVSELTDEQEKAFTEKLEEVYSAIDNAELEGSNNSILGRALEAVKIIKDNIRYTDKHEDIRDRYEAFAEYFKGKTYISEAQAAELRYHFGGVDKANQLVKGLNFVIEHHTSNRTLDNKWGEITELFPEMFEENDLSASDVDEPVILIHAMQNARDIIDGTLYSPFDTAQLRERAESDSYSALIAAEEETENDLAVAIMDSYDDVRWRATFADKKKAQIVALKAKQKQAMSEYRQQVKERTDKKIAELEEKYQRKLDRAERQKAIRDDRLAEYKAKVKESRIKATESKKRTELRNKIKKEYLKIAQMAANPTKDKHVPNGLLSVVKDLIYNIQLDDRTNAKALLYFAKIQNEFKALENNPNYNSLIDDYNSALSNYIVRVQSSIGNTDFRDLSANQLGELYNLVRMIKKCISNGNKMFRFEKQKSVDELRNKVVSELEARQSDKKDYFAGSRQFVINDLKPVYFFRHLHSPTMNALYQTLREGQDVWAVDIAEAKDFATKMRDKYHYSDWKLNEKFKFKLESGQEIEMNLLQVMNLRALSRRDNAMNHLLAGGIQLRAGTEETRAFRSRQNAKGKNEKTIYHTSFADIQNIISVLTEDQKRYSDEMQSYLSKEMAQKGNEVSRELYDIDLFGEENYVPIISSNDYVALQEQKVAGERKLKNSSFTNSVVPNASNPVMVTEFNDVWAEHVDEMSLYHGFTLPLEDFQKVYGYYSISTDELGNTKTTSVRGLLKQRDNAYINRFLRDINGGMSKDNTLGVGKWVAKSKKIATALNMSVALQQPSAVARAFVYINPKYFAATSFRQLSGIKADSKLVEEMMKYAPVARIKDMGYFDVDTGRTAKDYLNDHNYTKAKEKAWAMIVDGQYRDSVMLAAPETMDRITWCHIWQAAKAKVKAETDLTGEELLKEAGKVFSECIDLTQVYDSVFSRSAHMRSKDTLASMATAFMAEPTTAFNMLYDAIGQVKNGEKGKGFIISTFASVGTAVIFNAMLKSIITTARHGKKDDNWWEKYVGEFTANALDDLIVLNNIPIIKDIYSILQGGDVTRTDMALISEWYKSIKKLTKDDVTWQDYLSIVTATASLGGIPLKSLQKDLTGVYNAVQMFFNKTHTTSEGVNKQLNSSLSDSMLVDNVVNDVFGGHLWETSNSKYDMIYQLMNSGKKDEAQLRKKLLFETDGTAAEEGLNNYIVKKLMNNRYVIQASSYMMKGNKRGTDTYLNKVQNFDSELALKATYRIVNAQVNDDVEQIKEDTLVKVSAQSSLEQNLLKNNLYVRKAAKADYTDNKAALNKLKQALVQQGFSMEEVKKAITSMRKKMYGSKQKNKKEKKEYTYSDVANAMLENDKQAAATATKKLIEIYKADGKTEKEIKKSIRYKITDKFRSEYYDADNDRRREIRFLMQASGAYNGVDHIINACNKWLRDEAKER